MRDEPKERLRRRLEKILMLRKRKQDARVTGIMRDTLRDSRSFWKLLSHDVTMTHIYI